MIEGRQAECGGAVISKRADAPWPEGSFQEELGLWQQEWFYITTPRGSRQRPPPAFRPGPPPRLTSWVNKGFDWGPSKDVPLLQGRIRDLLERERSGRSSVGHADSSHPALQTSPPPPVGIQSGGTTSSPTLYGYKTRGDVQTVLRITRSVSGLDRGR